MRGVIFAGGGTGGHIYPSIAIAERLAHHDPALPMSVICSTRSIDRRVLEAGSLAAHPVNAQPFGWSPRLLARFAMTWRSAVRACQRILRERCAARQIEPASCVLVAMGGFVSPPAVHAARSLSMRRVLVNLDAVPGRANRYLASHVERVFSTYAFGPAQRVGPIVRRAARRSLDPAACRTALGLEPDRPTLLITGASLGARSVNDFVLALCAQKPEIFSGWQILHQAGEDQREPVARAYESLRVSARVVGLVDEVGLMWGACDAAIARSGAGTVAEAWINTVPTLFMPYPYHRDAHQKHNAQPIVDAGGAQILDDHIASDANVRAHASTVEQLLRDAPMRAAWRAGMAGLSGGDGADEIAQALRNL
jgi:UDP-N-acetylglucosamine--N-acetylmuramyl-(pentapeptide) pyrophosphoryl-undecaprenol N-acetylglucosamine transferase